VLSTLRWRPLAKEEGHHSGPPAPSRHISDSNSNSNSNPEAFHALVQWTRRIQRAGADGAIDLLRQMEAQGTKPDLVG
jgi:hypothetical protein